MKFINYVLRPISIAVVVLLLFVLFGMGCATQLVPGSLEHMRQEAQKERTAKWYRACVKANMYPKSNPWAVSYSPGGDHPLTWCHGWAREQAKAEYQ